MARSLLAVPIFAASIDRSAAALEPHGVDLKHILTDAPDAAFEDVINSFVSIAAVQVALVDVLRELGLRPDGIVGHSVGEVGACAAPVGGGAGPLGRRRRPLTRRRCRCRVRVRRRDADGRAGGAVRVLARAQHRGRQAGAGRHGGGGARLGGVRGALPARGGARVPQLQGQRHGENGRPGDPGDRRGGGPCE